MKDVAALKRDLSAARKLKQEARRDALNALWRETYVLENAVAQNPTFMSFYGVRELHEFVVELDKWIKKSTEAQDLAKKYS